MNSEQHTPVSPELLLAEFNNRRPVLMVVQERSEVGFDSTYDRFMHQYVGDPVFEDFKDVFSSNAEYGQLNHNYRRLTEFSQDGDLIVIREDRRLPYTAPARYMPVTASLREHAIVPWVVTDVKFPRLGSRTGLELILSTRRLEVVEDTPDPVNYPVNPVKFVLDHWQGGQSQKKLPSILLDDNHCSFTDHANRQVTYQHDLEQLHYGLVKYKKLEQEAGDLVMMDLVELAAVQAL